MEKFTIKVGLGLENDDLELVILKVISNMMDNSAMLRIKLVLIKV